MAWIDGSTGSVADRGVIVKVTVISGLDSVGFDMIHYGRCCCEGFFFTGATAMRYGQPEEEVCPKERCARRDKHAHRSIVRSGTDIRRGYAKTSKEKS